MQTMRSELTGCPVIIGGGLAGLMTALRLAPRPVILLAKVPLNEGAASAWAQGGIAAAVGEDDRPALHAADTLAAGDGLNDPIVVSRIAAAAPAAIIELERHGVVFDRDKAGRLALGLEAAHARRRIVHVAGDGTGAAIMRALVAAVQATPSITVIEGLEARRLLIDDRGIAGVLAAGPSDACLLQTRRVVLATGGLGGLYAHTTNPLGAIGQGLALAARAGAALADMEFVQFHPTALDVGLDPMPLVSEAVRGEGAVLVDETGARFMAGKGHGELEPRDVVSRAVAAHIAAGHRVFLDARPALGADFVKHFPGITARCRAAGIDPVRQAIPVRPAVHYHMGGIAVDGEGRSTIEGLWACGEVAASGLHGANRLASNSLLEAVVMASAVADSLGNIEPAPLPAARPVALPSAPDVKALRGPIGERLGVVRDRAGLERAVDHLQPLAFKGGSAADPALVALMIATAALAREESRGGHWRADFPQTSPAWARRLVQRVHDTGTRLVCRAVPLSTVPQPLVAGA
ncbi:L-aspartate oxidase [Reyranella soli]|uniref:L-aspartate oxidase n=1 Tax=Reyranella soli TaxID=1230389 RepID=A0A512NQZ8_9HYPH|nr:L-aspartate oxidase [Reyranella soli]GEP61369.1 L-aspartate oxidase [Reyranella soli]